MGRTNQVLTGGSIYSTSPQTTTMKIVLALLVLCLFQFSLAELEDVDNAETNLVLERDIREAGKNCPQGKEGKQCRKRQKKRKSRKRYPGGWQKLPTRKRGEAMQKEAEEKEKQEEISGRLAKIAHKEKRGSNAERGRRKGKAGRARKEEAKKQKSGKGRKLRQRSGKKAS